MTVKRNILRTFLLIFCGLVSIILLFSVKRDIPVGMLKQKYGLFPSEFMAVEGMDIHYRDEGWREDTLPLVLLHGTSSSLHTYDGWVRLLAGKRRTIRLDLPGFGLTGPFPDKNYSIQHYTDVLNSFLKQLNIDRFVLAGNSLGGEIAWNYAINYPGKAAGLVLIDAAGLEFTSSHPPLAFRIARIPVLKHALTYITPRAVARKSVKEVYADPLKVDEELVSRYFDLTLRAGNRQAMVDRLNWPQDHTNIKQIPSIKVPVLIIWGKEDKLIPEKCGVEFSEMLPRDTLVVLGSCGHVPMEECPEKTMEVLNGFLEKL